MEADTLETVNSNLVASAFYGTFAFVPVIDGTFIVERPSVTLGKGRVNGVRHCLCSFSNELFDIPKASTALCDQPERGERLCERARDVDDHGLRLSTFSRHDVSPSPGSCICISKLRDGSRTGHRGYG